jgi:uncharacterized protein with WD repeat
MLNCFSNGHFDFYKSAPWIHFAMKTHLCAFVANRTMYQGKCSRRYRHKATTGTYMTTATRTTAKMSTMKQECHLPSYNEQYKANKVNGQKQERGYITKYQIEYDYHMNNYESKQRQRRQTRQRQQLRQQNQNRSKINNNEDLNNND